MQAISRRNVKKLGMRFALSDVVSTWFFTQNRTQGGTFAQVREDSASEFFRDIYRRCIGVFFVTARRANPDARLVLYLNQEWDGSASTVSGEVERLLDYLGVETKVLEYTHEPPMTFTKAWRNQFFVLDVLNDLALSLNDRESAAILDSDIVWTTRQKAAEFWAAVRDSSVITYEVGYQRHHLINGQSISDLESLMEVVKVNATSRVTYCGGEIVAGTREGLSNLADHAHTIWQQLMRIHTTHEEMAFEEAHVLSIAYAAMGCAPGTCNTHIRRLWTQPLKPRNTQASDLILAMWHLPAEKKYGIERLYRDILHRGPAGFMALSDTSFIEHASRRVGLPRNSVVKVVQDVSRAGLARIRKKAE